MFIGVDQGYSASASPFSPFSRSEVANMAGVADYGVHRARVRTNGLPRRRGAVNGLLLILLGAWGGLVPFLGPRIGLNYTADAAWTFTWAKLWLEVLPGVAVLIGGLGLIGTAARAGGVLWGWLAALGGAGPISSTGSPIATPTIDGVTWNLFSGPNGAMTVYSFVAQSQASSFSGDLLDFFTYLESSQGYPSSQYLLSIGAGTEPFTGSNAVLTTSAYSTVVN